MITFECCVAETSSGAQWRTPYPLLGPRAALPHPSPNDYKGYMAIPYIHSIALLFPTSTFPSSLSSLPIFFTHCSPFSYPPFPLLSLHLHSPHSPTWHASCLSIHARLAEAPVMTYATVNSFIGDARIRLPRGDRYKPETYIIHSEQTALKTATP